MLNERPTDLNSNTPTYSWENRRVSVPTGRLALCPLPSGVIPHVVVADFFLFFGSTGYRSRSKYELSCTSVLRRIMLGLSGSHTHTAVQTGKNIERRLSLVTSLLVTSTAASFHSSFDVIASTE